MIDEIDAAVVATDTSAHFTGLREPPPARQARPGRKAHHRDRRAGGAARWSWRRRTASSSRSATWSGSIPAVEAVENMISDPRFIEVQRLGSFSARSLDIDVVLDLMIHDLDIILALIKDEVVAIKSSGIHVVSEKTDIANARLEFRSGCVATLTASRVHQGKVRKLRIFEPTVLLFDRLHRPGGQGLPPRRPPDRHQDAEDPEGGAPQEGAEELPGLRRHGKDDQGQRRGGPAGPAAGLRRHPRAAGLTPVSGRS